MPDEEEESFFEDDYPEDDDFTEEETQTIPLVPEEPVLVNKPQSRRPVIEVVEENQESLQPPEVLSTTPPVDTVCPSESEKKPTFFEWLKGIVPSRSLKEPESPPELPPVKSGPSYIEKKFGFVVEEKKPAEPPMETPKTRTPPLPQVKMVPRGSLFERTKYKFKHYWAFSWMFYGEKELERQEKTGLTPRQRIKRYNAIHEGGYGKPVLNDGDVEQDGNK